MRKLRALPRYYTVHGYVALIEVVKYQPGLKFHILQPSYCATIDDHRKLKLKSLTGRAGSITVEMANKEHRTVVVGIVSILFPRNLVV